MHMSRDKQFERTKTFSTPGVHDGQEDSDKVSFLGMELNQTPDPGGRTTLEVSIESETGTNSAYVTAYVEGTEVADITGKSIDAGGETASSVIITAPSADEFDVTVEGGIVN